MKMLKLFPFLFCLGFFTACSDEDKDQDDVLDMSKLTGKYWYYNKWQNDKNSYVLDDLLEIIRFEENGKLWEMDFGGKNEKIVGTWMAQENAITLRYTSRPEEIWNVLKSDKDFIEAMVFGGKREYRAEPDYLKNLTADAYLMDEVKNDGVLPETRISISIAGKNAVNIAKDAAVILDRNHTVPLTLKNKEWTESEPILASDYELPAEGREIRFYIKVSGNPVKFSDYIYAEGLPKRKFQDFDLSAQNQDRSLLVKWKPFEDENNKIYYQIEVLNDAEDVANPYFVSRLQSPHTSQLEITETTTTDQDKPNNLKNLKAGQTYTVRLSAVLLEPGTSAEDLYSYTNRQAVSSLKWKYVWQ